MTYIAPTHKDYQGKTFTFTVTGNAWTDNKWGNGKKDRMVKNENGDDDVLVLTEGWFKDSKLADIKIGDEIKLCFDTSKDDWFDVKINSKNVTGKEVYLTDEDIANIDSGNGVTNDPITTSHVSTGPDWDKIAAGKVRNGFALKAFEMNWKLDATTKETIETWVEFVMDKKEPQPF